MSGNIVSNPTLAKPGLVGGPGQLAAAFIYPPLLLDQGSTKCYQSYNAKDAVNISWVSWAENDTETVLQLWYWTPNFATNIWYPLSSEVVPANGSKVFQLDQVPDWQSQYYIGQWNLNFTRSDKSPATGLTLSGFFNCSFADVPSGTTWDAAGSSTNTAILNIGPAIPTSTVSTTQDDDAPAQRLPSSSSTPEGYISGTALASASSPLQSLSNGKSSSNNMLSGNAAISGGAVAGIVISVFIAFGFGACAMYLLLVRRKQRPAQGDVSIAEKDSQNRVNRPRVFFRRLNMTTTAVSTTSPQWAPDGPPLTTIAEDRKDYWSRSADSELPTSGFDAGFVELSSKSEPRELL